jgi:hypothetical protein
MAIANREKNRTSWGRPPVIGRTRFTPCEPIDWIFEFGEFEEESPGDDKACVVRDVTSVTLVLRTPSNAELLELATQFPPPQDWFDEEDAGPPF